MTGTVTTPVRHSPQTLAWDTSLRHLGLSLVVRNILLFRGASLWYLQLLQSLGLCLAPWQVPFPGSALARRKINSADQRARFPWHVTSLSYGICTVPVRQNS